MEQFEIRCTPQQTQKALQLGAPIIKVDTRDKRLIYGSNMCYPRTEADYPYAIPTAEEMIGWLEKQSITEISIIKCSFVSDFWGFGIFSEHEGCIAENTKDFNSRKKATIAAIDAALDYLSNKKKQYHGKIQNPMHSRTDAKGSATRGTDRINSK